MTDINTPLPEIDQHRINPNDDIQSLVGSIDISSFDEDISLIVANPTTKELLVQALRENQPITGKLLLRKIINKIKDVQVKEEGIQVKEEGIQVKEEGIQVEQKQDQVEQKQDQVEQTNSKYFDQAKLATSEVSNAFSTFEQSSIPAEKKTEISSQISNQIANIKNGNIPAETKNFLNQIGANTPDKIGSPEVQDILRAHISTRVYLENKDSILKTNPELGEQFENLDRNKYALGISGKIEARNIGSALTDIPKSDKDTVVSTVNSLTKGVPDTLITRSGDRLNWEDQRGSGYEIDMSVHPPKLTKSLNGLSISRTEQEANPEVTELQGGIATSKESIKKSGTNIQENLTSSGIYGLHIESYSPTEIRELFSGINIDEFEAKINAATTPESQAALKEELRMTKSGSGGKLSKSAIEYMERIIDNKIELGKLGSSDESVESKDWREKIKSLKDLKSSDALENYAKEKEELEKKEKELEKIQSPSVENFDNNAQSTLSYLTHIGYDEIGQEVLDKVIASVNAKNQGKIAEIDLSKNPKLDAPQEKELLRVLAQLSRKTDIMHSWKGTDSTDEIIAVRQMTSPNWRISLQELGKTASFQEIKSASRDTFTDYLYEKPEEKSSTKNQS